MTYVSGGLIQAADYNGFVATSANNINTIWSTGSGDKGWGQTAIGQVAIGGTVTATQWATLVANLATSGQQTSSTLTSRTQPVAGNVIAILANVATDINTVTNNRGNAAAIGTEVGTFTGAVSKTTTTGSGQAAWTITFTQTLTFASADAARYFFNAGGIVKLQYGKTGGTTDHDPDWNSLASSVGSINFTGRVNANSQLIAGTTYTGTTRIGGSGSATVATTTGYYNLTAGGAAVQIMQINNPTAPYTPEFIRTTVALNAGSTVLTFVTTWVDDGTGVIGATSNISGGTAVTSPATSISGANVGPTTLLTYLPPSTTYLTNTWGTPTINSSVV